MPKSRGRYTGRRAKKSVRRSPRPVHPGDRVLRSATELTERGDLLFAEVWASGWLGEAWLNAALGDREAEQLRCTQVCARACASPSPHALAAVCAFARVAPPSEAGLLRETIDILTRTQPPPSWQPSPWTPVAAWRATDVWDSERVLFIDFDGPTPHTLLAEIRRAGGIGVGKLALLEPGAAASWDSLREDDEAPMPLASAEVGDVLAELADALRSTDMTWPRNDDDDFVDHRALVWSRCRDHLPEWPEHVGLTDTERDDLLDRFTHDVDDDLVTRSLADLFLDYGEGYIISGPLHWSPTEVMLLLTDWLPRKAVLDPEQRAALAETLRRWVRFALTERAVDPAWIAPVIEAVDTFAPEFEAAFDDHTSWGPAKQIAAALTERGVDLTDREAVDQAVRALNAENLARRLID
jgi:hypothetical protein